MGTPQSINASVEPQTDAMEDEPLEASTSKPAEACKEFIFRGNDRDKCPFRQRTVTDFAAEEPRSILTSPVL